MSAKKRYTKSFLVTSLLYASVFIVIAFSFKPFVQPLVLTKEKSISLNHISLITQEKKEIQKETAEEIKKEEPKKEEIKNESLPQERPKIVKPEIEKPIKPKSEPKKEEKKQEVVKEELKEEKKEIEKEQEELIKSLPKNYEQAFLDEHLQEIVRQIQKHINYPKRAKTLRIQGEVFVQFEILKQGSVQNIEALRGHMLLKKSAVEAIHEASRFFPKVEKNMTIKVPIVYSLKSVQ